MTKSKKGFIRSRVGIFPLFLTALALAPFLFVILNQIFSKKTQNKIPASLENVSFNQYCQRKLPWPKEARFSRAFDLIIERTWPEYNPRAKAATLMTSFGPISNCIKIDYCAPDVMNGAEGLFFFDPEISNRDQLQICVSQAYKAEDDLLTSMLIAHEAVHAIHFVMDKTGVDWGQGAYNKSCFGDEASAFSEEILYMLSLTDGEQQSLLARSQVYGKNEPKLAVIGDFYNIVINEIQKSCMNYGNDTRNLIKCVSYALPKRIEENLKLQPYYQKQCGNK